MLDPCNSARLGSGVQEEVPINTVQESAKTTTVSLVSQKYKQAIVVLKGIWHVFVNLPHTIQKYQKCGH